MTDATEWFSATFLRSSDAHSLVSVEEIIGAAVRDGPSSATSGNSSTVPRLEEVARSKDSWVAGAARLALFMIGSRAK